MRKSLVFVVMLFATVICLHGTQPFWSLEPSMRQIERADSLTGFDITKYVINLNIDTQSRFIEGMVEAQVMPLWAIDGISYELEGDSLFVSQVLLNDTAVNFSHEDGVINIPLPPATRNSFVTKVFYSGVPSRSPSPYNIGMIFTSNSVYTLSNPDAGRYYWPCYDHPWDKALVDWNIRIREDWLVAANGTRTGITDHGDGTRSHHWSCSSPVATYVMGFAAAPYIEFSQQAGDIPIQNFVLPAQLNNAQTDFANTPAMIDFFGSIFGAYPFEKYGHAVVNMATYAAMEHQTMTTYGSQYLTGDQTYEHIVAHELAHQWYGNLVTPITMREVWLKESFATYSEFLWEAHHYGWERGLNYLRNKIQQYYLSWENSNGPQTIFDPAYNMMFAPPTYQKSASVLHMLRLKMGNDDFFDFIRSIITTYPGGNINTAEFVDLAEQASGQDLSQFFQQWIYSPGVPNATFSMLQNGAGLGKIIGKTISPTSTLFDIEVPIRIPGSAVADSLVIRATAEGYVNYFPISLNDDISELQIDPNHWVLTRSFNTNKLQLASCLAYDAAVDLAWFPWPEDMPLAGYHVYRKLLPDGDFVQITDAPLSGLSFTDYDVKNGNSYLYRVCAQDLEGFQTQPSNAMEAKPIEFLFDQGILMVDETRDGTGANISPTNAEVDEFYHFAMNDMAYEEWDLDLQPELNIEVLSHYPLVLWHSDDFSDLQILHHLDMLGSYVLSGGKLIVSGWKYPSQFDDAFLNKFLPGITPQLVNAPVLTALESDVYPDLHPDPQKLAAPWSGMFPMTYVFPGASNVLYSANLVGNDAFNGEPAAIRVENGGSMILLGFPLYFMMRHEVRDFLGQLIPELYPQVELNDEYVPAAEIRVSCHPNPFKRASGLDISFPKSLEPFEVRIYNIKGQKVGQFKASSFEGSDGKIRWNGRDGGGKALPSGVYLIEALSDKHRQILRVVMLD